jgi:hypothetical protein
MKKLLSFIVLALLLSSTCYADIFSPIGEQKEKVSQNLAIPGVDPSTLIGEAAQLAAALGTREGFFYDVKQHEITNYLAATLITDIPYGISASFGAINTDGIGVSLDWNAGAIIPAQNVPLLGLFQYFYIGLGAGARYLDEGDGSRWQFAWGPTAELKLTF